MVWLGGDEKFICLGSLSDTFRAVSKEKDFLRYFEGILNCLNQERVLVG